MFLEAFIAGEGAPERWRGEISGAASILQRCRSRAGQCCVLPAKFGLSFQGSCCSGSASFILGTLKRMVWRTSHSARVFALHTCVGF